MIKRFVTIAVAVLLGVQLSGAVEGALSGKFSVSANRQVQFAQGNLQYNAMLGKHKCADKSTKPGTWRLADNQFAIIGEANAQASKTYDGWIDLFGWCASGYKDVHPWVYVRKKMAEVTVSEELVNGDPAWYNAISNGGDEPGLWRSLTAEEWQYLIDKRLGARELQRVVKISGVQGLLLLPDVQDEQSYMRMVSGVSDDYGDLLDELTMDHWDLLEARGAVFLPLAGLMRMRDEAYQVRMFISCYMATPWDKTSRKAVMAGVQFSDDDKRAEFSDYNNIHSHCSVRPVVDVK